MGITLADKMQVVASNGPNETVIEGFTLTDSVTNEFIDEDGDVVEGLTGYSEIFETAEEANTAIQEAGLEDAAVVPVKITIAVGPKSIVTLEDDGE